MRFVCHYMRDYEQCQSETSTESAPWYCVPADNKENARRIISQVILNALEGLDMAYPEPQMSSEGLESIRKKLAD